VIVVVNNQQNIVIMYRSTADVSSYIAVSV